MDPDNTGAFRLFLDYGALGFAALMLVLVFYAMSAQDLTAARERVLRLFMWIGAGCFVIAVAAEFFAVDGEHTLNLTVNPNDLNDDFPPPKLMLNGTRVDGDRSFALREDATVLIDVSDAVGSFRAVSSRAADQETALRQADRLTEELATSLQDLRGNVTESSSGTGALRLDRLNEIEELNAETREMIEAIR